MARPKKDEKLVPFTVMLLPTIIQEIKEIAERGQIPAGKLARNMLLCGLDDARLLDKFSLIALFASSKQALEKVKKKFNLSWDNIDIYKE